MKGPTTLRGQRLSGHTSFQKPYLEGRVQAMVVPYRCPRGDHEFVRRYSAELGPDEVPETADCPQHGEVSACADPGVAQAPKAPRPPRTHWVMLCERRTPEQLEALLAEALEKLRVSRGEA
ncbi:hypothetical protein JOF53_006498 [Crossiella equi]|uniref:RNA polymerase-binding protein RbpA n=1 Tax=Crossiella equi TaxID=130796 RepID=A0ABS5AM44_9PSEU|nr:RNA polymerase-binding protein RbpA [Crossiella equi]MBP2477626.1 hypothetical protein [Crossiella equi]